MKTAFPYYIPWNCWICYLSTNFSGSNRHSVLQTSFKYYCSVSMVINMIINLQMLRIKIWLKLINRFALIPFARYLAHRYYRPLVFLDDTRNLLEMIVVSRVVRHIDQVSLNFVDGFFGYRVGRSNINSNQIDNLCSI